MRLIEYQLRNSLTNVEQIRKAIDHKMDDEEVISSSSLENWHYELLDMELRLKDMLRNIDQLEQDFQKKCE